MLRLEPALLRGAVATLVVASAIHCAKSAPVVSQAPSAPPGPPQLVLATSRSTATTAQGVVVTSFLRNGDYSIAGDAVVGLDVSGGGTLTHVTRDVYGVTTATLAATNASHQIVRASLASANGDAGADAGEAASAKTADVDFAASGPWFEADTGISLGYMGALQIAIDPFDPDRIDLPGGVTYETLNGAITWSPIAPPSQAYDGGAPGASGIPFMTGLVFDPHHAGTLLEPIGLDPSTTCWAKTTDDGATWTTFPGWLYTGLTFDPNVADVLYATQTDATGSSATLVKSTDGGASWASLATNLPGYANLAIAPGASNVIYAAGLGAAVSTDGGATFTACPQVPSGFTTVAAADAKTAFVAVGGKGTWKTGDGGASWTQVVPAPTGISLNYPVFALDPRDSTFAFAFDEDQRALIRTTDGGATWTVARANVPDVSAIAVNPQHDEIVYAVSPQALLRSADHGATWSADSQGLPIGRAALAIGPGAPSLLAQLSSGLFRSTDGAHTWSHVDALPAEFWGGVTARLAGGGILVTAAGGMIVTNTPPLAIARSTDDGATWTTSAIPSRIDELFAAPDNPNVVYSSSFAQDAPPNGPQPAAPLRSTDGGATWKALAVPPPQGQDPAPYVTLFPGPSGTVYLVLGAEDSVGFVSHDRGDTWSPTGLHNVNVFRADPSDPNVAWALGTLDPHYVAMTTLLHSTDGGATWAIVESIPADAGTAAGGAPSIPFDYWAGLLVAPDDPKTLFVIGNGPTPTMLVTHDAGISFQPVIEPPNMDSSGQYVAAVSSKMLVSTGFDGIFASETGGI